MLPISQTLSSAGRFSNCSGRKKLNLADNAAHPTGGRVSGIAVSAELEPLKTEMPLALLRFEPLSR